MKEIIKCPEQFDYLGDANVLKSFLSLDYSKSLENADIAIKGISSFGNDLSYMRNITFWIDAVSDADVDIRIDGVLKIIDNGDLDSSLNSYDDDLIRFMDNAKESDTFPIYVTSQSKHLEDITSAYKKKGVIYFGANTLNSVVDSDSYDENVSIEIGTRISTSTNISKSIKRFTSKTLHYNDVIDVKIEFTKYISSQSYILVCDFNVLDASVSFGSQLPVFGGIMFFKVVELLDMVISLVDLECIVFISPNSYNDPDEISLNYAQELLKKLVILASKKIIEKK